MRIKHEQLKTLRSKRGVAKGPGIKKKPAKKYNLGGKKSGKANQPAKTGSQTKPRSGKQPRARTMRAIPVDEPVQAASKPTTPQDLQHRWQRMHADALDTMLKEGWEIKGLHVTDAWALSLFKGHLNGGKLDTLARQYVEDRAKHDAEFLESHPNINRTVETYIHRTTQQFYALQRANP